MERYAYIHAGIYISIYQFKYLNINLLYLMCLPLGLLKCFVKFNSFICILLGLATFICAIILNVQANNNGFFNYDTGYDNYGLMICLYIFGIALLLLGLCGYVGGKKKSKCLLLVFDIGMLIGFLTFASIGLASCVLAHAASQAENDTTSDCMNAYPWSNNIYQESV